MRVLILLSMIVSAYAQCGTVFMTADSGIYKSSDYGNTLESVLTDGWESLASTADGTFLAATSTNSSTPEVWISQDSGATWAEEAASVSCGSSRVESSASGEILVQVCWDDGSANGLYISEDFGDTWTQEKEEPIERVAISSDGNMIMYYYDGSFYTNIQRDETWLRTDVPGTSLLKDITMSATGRYISVILGNDIYVSSDYGDTFVNKKTDNFKTIAMSASGKYQFATSTNTSHVDIYNSSDYGSTWTSVYSGLGNSWDNGIDVSSDGKYVAISGHYTLYTSNNYGSTWVTDRVTNNDEPYHSIKFTDDCLSSDEYLDYKFTDPLNPGNTIYCQESSYDEQPGLESTLANLNFEVTSFCTETSCTGNTKCVNNDLWFECVCLPRFTGGDCETCITGYTGNSCEDCDTGYVFNETSGDCDLEPDVDCVVEWDTPTCNGSIASSSTYTITTAQSGDGTACPAEESTIFGTCYCNLNTASNYNSSAVYTNNELCTCDTGYSVDGVSCVDINECNTKSGIPLVHNINVVDHEYTNIPSQICKGQTYTFKRSSDGHIINISGTIIDTTPTSLTKHSLGFINYVCTSHQSMAGLIEVISCNGDCDTNAVCTNTPGSYGCACNAGYSGNGTSCTDDDECASNPCHANATCTDGIDSYTCTCNEGFSGNGTSCTKDACEPLPWNIPCPVLGCTDATAFNYNSSANTDDGSCIAKIFGCRNQNADNYNENANTDAPCTCGMGRGFDIDNGVCANCTYPTYNNESNSAFNETGICSNRQCPAGEGIHRSTWLMMEFKSCQACPQNHYSPVDNGQCLAHTSCDPPQILVGATTSSAGQCKTPCDCGVRGLFLSLYSEDGCEGACICEQDEIHINGRCKPITRQISDEFKNRVQNAHSQNIISNIQDKAQSEQKNNRGRFEYTTSDLADVTEASSDVRKYMLKEQRLNIANNEEADMKIEMSFNDFNATMKLSTEVRNEMTKRNIQYVVTKLAKSRDGTPQNCSNADIHMEQIPEGEFEEVLLDENESSLKCNNNQMISLVTLIVDDIDDSNDVFAVQCLDGSLVFNKTHGETYTCAATGNYKHLVMDDTGGSLTCDTSAPDFGTNGACGSILAEGATCIQTCNPGYAATSYEATCTAGIFTPIECESQESQTCNNELFQTPNGDACKCDNDCQHGSCSATEVCECIEVGQRVLMADGTHKNIEHLVPGDVLRTPEGITTVRSTRRGGRHLSGVHDVDCNGQKAAITGNHAYFCDGEWRLPQETHDARSLTGVTDVVAVETDNYCEDKIILESGLHVETWDGRGVDEWRPHTYENGRRLRCTLKGSWRDRVLQRIDSKN